jgi:predicted  nucleic acid-binding Zn-ribbon protein
MFSLCIKEGPMEKEYLEFALKGIEKELDELEARKKLLKKQLSEIQARLGKSRRRRDEVAEQRAADYGDAVYAPKRRRMPDDVRQKLSEAQKRRWALRKGETETLPK